MPAQKDGPAAVRRMTWTSGSASAASNASTSSRQSSALSAFRLAGRLRARWRTPLSRLDARVLMNVLREMENSDRRAELAPIGFIIGRWRRWGNGLSCGISTWRRVGAERKIFLFLEEVI